MYEETDAERRDHIAASCGLVVFALTAIVLCVYRLFLGPTLLTVSLPFTETSVLDVFPTGRNWDLLIAPIWATLTAMYCLDGDHGGRAKLTPLFGLLTSGALYLCFWGEPGIAVWLLLPPVALIEARILDLIDRARIADAGLPAPPRFGISDAIGFCLAFGLGMLLPFAVVHGFMLTALYPFMGYLIICFALCVVVFGLLGVLRLTASLWQKWLRKPDGSWTWSRLGVSNLVEEHENAPWMKLKEPPKELAEKVIEDLGRRRGNQDD